MTGGPLSRNIAAYLAGPRAWAAAIIFVGAIATIPALNVFVSPGSAAHLPDFYINIVGKWMCIAVLALSIDLIWGYCGILSLGHGAFFALGGYAMGMHLMRVVGERGVYRNPLLPDFMVFLNWKTLPWYWYGFDHFAFALVMALLVPGALALIFGWFAFRSRITGVYFSIITQAMTFALMLAFFRNDMGFGGNNGLTDFKDILGLPLTRTSTRIVLYFASAAALLGSYILCRWAIGGKYGRVLIAIRDAESRARFLGYDVTAYKLSIFTASAMLAGLAGALYVPQVGIINPSEFSPAASIEAVIWVAVGGRGTLYGAIIGALVVNGAKTWLTSVAAELWPYVLGILFVAVTIFLPRGLVGLVEIGVRRVGRAATPVTAVAEPQRGGDD